MVPKWTETGDVDVWKLTKGNRQASALVVDLLEDSSWERGMPIEQGHPTSDSIEGLTSPTERDEPIKVNSPTEQKKLIGTNGLIKSTEPIEFNTFGWVCLSP